MDQERDFPIRIEPKLRSRHFFSELWNYRELFYFLSWRDILVRYKQTVLGILWSIIRPLLTMVIFTFIFGRLARLPSEGIPYPLMVFAAMLPWFYFASSLSECSNSLVANSNLVTKMYFPRIIIPSSAVLITVVEFVIWFVILLGMMAWYRHLPDWRILFVPFLLILTLLLSLGFGLWFSALNVRYRDFRYVIPFMIQIGLYISPVGFSLSVIPEKWRFFYSLNPVVGLIDAFRWALLRGKMAVYWPALWLSLGTILIVFVSGFIYFRKAERTFADTI